MNGSVETTVEPANRIAARPLLLALCGLWICTVVGWSAPVRA